MFQTTKYIDPLVDFAFKKIFGSDSNKDLLIDFLNEVFNGRKHIVDLIYNKNEHPGELKKDGGVIFDLLCTGDHNDHFIIEIQRGKQQNFKQRALFYTSRLISDQAPKGKRSTWGYKLTEVFLIALLEDTIASDFSKEQYFHEINLCDRNTGKVFYEKLGYIYIELHKFVKTANELETGLDKWLFALKNMGSMDKIPAGYATPVFEKLFNIAQYTNLTKEEKMLWDNNLKRKWDNQNVLDYALNEARELGHQLGHQEGHQEGHQAGIEQGIEQGIKENVRKTVIKMKEKGLSFQQIAEITDLQISEIEDL